MTPIGVAHFTGEIYFQSGWDGMAVSVAGLASGLKQFSRVFPGSTSFEVLQMMHLEFVFGIPADSAGEPVPVQDFESFTLPSGVSE